MIDNLTDEQLEALNGEAEENLAQIAEWILSDIHALNKKVLLSNPRRPLQRANAQRNLDSAAAEMRDCIAALTTI